MSEVKAAIFPPEDGGGSFTVAVKWDGWGVKGEGASLEDAIANMVHEVLDYERSLRRS